MSTVFLGGTCNGSTWRERLIPLLKVTYYNPVVNNWTLVAEKREYIEKEIALYNLFVITPLMLGVYSIAELTDMSNKRPLSTLGCILREDDGETFDDAQWKSLMAVKRLAQSNGSKFFNTLEDIANYLNLKSKK
jgi:hypothetical protein